MSKQQQADSSTDYLSPEQADEALKKMIRGDKNGNRTLVLSPEIDHIPGETILNFIQENNITAVGNVIIALMSQRRECSYDLFTYQCSEYKINPNFLRILDIIKDANITSLDLIGLDYGASDWGFDYFRHRGEDGN